MTIRPAKPADIPAIQALLAQILRLHHQARPDIFEAQGSKYTDEELTAILANPQTPVFVYTDTDGQLLGHLFLQHKTAGPGPKKPVKSLYIDDLCITEAARGRGAGQELYDFAKAYAKKSGCYNLTLNVWNANAGALRFYQRQGMTAQQTQMEEIL